MTEIWSRLSNYFNNASAAHKNGYRVTPKSEVFN